LVPSRKLGEANGGQRILAGRVGSYKTRRLNGSPWSYNAKEKVDERSRGGKQRALLPNLPQVKSRGNKARKQIGEGKEPPWVERVNVSKNGIKRGEPFGEPDKQGGRIKMVHINIKQK